MKLKYLYAFVLFSLFIYFFGYPSILKYLAMKTTVSISREHVEYVTAPAITLISGLKNGPRTARDCSQENKIYAFIMVRITFLKFFFRKTKLVNGEAT